MSDFLVSKIEKRLGHISMMERGGFEAGTAKHTGMVQETADYIMNLLKQTRQIESAIAVDIHDVLAAKLGKQHLDTAMSLIHSKVAKAVENASTKQKNRHLDNYLMEDHWQCYQDPRVI